MATATGITTTTAASGWSPDVNYYQAADFIPESLLLQTATIAGEIDGDSTTCKVAFIRDSGSTGAGATVKRELEQLDDEEPDMADLELRTVKLGRLATVSSEMFEKPNTASQLAASFCRDLTRRADVAYMDGIDGLLVGMRNLAGATKAAAPVATNLDSLVDLLAELECAGAHPTHVVVDPRSWASLRKLKTANDHNSTLLPSGADDTQPKLLGLTVLRSEFMTPGSGLVLDKSEVVSAVGPVKIAQSEHAQFARDGIVLRATMRIAWGCPKPERTGVFTVGGKK